METTLTIRGRQVTPADLTFIQSLIKDHWQKGRKFISQELCRHCVKKGTFCEKRWF